MNIDIKTLAAKVHALLAPKEKLHTRPIARPVRDWKIALLCLFVGFGFAAFLAGFVYVSLSTVSTISGDVTSVKPKSKIKDAEIQDILVAFATRAESHRKYENGEGVIPDPSH